jgi:hypothetical protein
MLKSEIIDRAADYIARSRNNFNWCYRDTCIVGILARISMGAQTGRMLSADKMDEIGDKIEGRMKEALLADRWSPIHLTCPYDQWATAHWSQLMEFETKSGTALSYVFVCLGEHGFSMDDIVNAEYTHDKDVLSAAGLKKKTCNAINRLRAVRYLRAWANLEREHEKKQESRKCDRNGVAVLAMTGS